VPVRVTVEQQRGVIGIAQNRPVIRQESTRPVLKLSRELPRLQISGGGVSVRIDQTQCFIEKGLKPPSVLANECAGAGRRAALEGITRRAREGDFLASIEEGATVADLALPEEKFEVALALLPRTRPAVEFIEEPLRVNAVPGKVTVDFTPGTVKAVKTPSPPYLHVYLEQEPFVKIQAVPEKIDVAV
jgi:hypothetical protein